MKQSMIINKLHHFSHNLKSVEIFKQIVIKEEKNSLSAKISTGRIISSFGK